MKQTVSLNHKQIACVSYDPDDGSLTIIYHRGERRRHPFADTAAFQTLLEDSNKVDILCQLLSRRFG